MVSTAPPSHHRTLTVPQPSRYMTKATADAAEDMGASYAKAGGIASESISEVRMVGDRTWSVTVQSAASTSIIQSSSLSTLELVT